MITGTNPAGQEKLCDLHTHSCFSDGTCTPAELVALAEKRGIAALALTDHNTTAGLPAFLQAGAQSPVITVPGCEFSTEYEGREVHIVGLFLPPSAWPEVEDYVALLRMAKDHSNRKLIRALQADGYAVTYEEAAALTQADAFNRAHVARVLLDKGYVHSVREAFDTLLREGGGYYTPAHKLNVFATIRFIKTYGGVAVLAHPFLNLDETQLETFLPQAKKAGLDAMETHYSEFDAETTQRAVRLASRFALHPGGGSDFHGAAKPDIALGTGRGDLAVPFAFYETLRRIFEHPSEK